VARIHEPVEVATSPSDEQIETGSESAGVPVDDADRTDLEAAALDPRCRRRRDSSLRSGSIERPAFPRSDRAKTASGPPEVHTTIVDAAT
jgi:hypothetical protein